MIIHTTRKLADRLPNVSKDSPLGSWHADRLTLDHRQCVLFCHDASRAALFLAGLRKPEFERLGGEIFRTLFADTLVSLGLGQSNIQRALLATGPIRFDAATDRSVLSSVRVARQDLEAYLVTSFPNVLMMDPVRTPHRLTHRPVSVRGKHFWPQDKLLEMIDSLE
jgi:hypothetical protein